MQPTTVMHVVPLPRYDAVAASGPNGAVVVLLAQRLPRRHRGPAIEHLERTLAAATGPYAAACLAVGEAEEVANEPWSLLLAARQIVTYLHPTTLAAAIVPLVTVPAGAGLISAAMIAGGLHDDPTATEAATPPAVSADLPAAPRLRATPTPPPTPPATQQAAPPDPPTDQPRLADLPLMRNTPLQVGSLVDDVAPLTGALAPIVSAVAPPADPAPQQDPAPQDHAPDTAPTADDPPPAADNDVNVDWGRWVLRHRARWAATHQGPAQEQQPAPDPASAPTPAPTPAPDAAPVDPAPVAEAA